MKELFILTLIFLSACRSIDESSKDIDDNLIGGLSSFINKELPYVGDESLDVFLLHPWYTYDENNHIIWPNFQVYALKAKGKYYKFQIADYYDDASSPGNYTIRLQDEGGEYYEWSFNAQGCGNVYTNLTYKECLKDPARNVYTYLNIELKSSWQMSDLEASVDKTWDIAFNGTEVKLNSGKSGPGGSRIGDLYLYQPFFNGEAANFQRIAEVSFADQGKRFFDLDLDLQSVALSLPQGVERVVDEKDWLDSTNEMFSAKDTNWWMLMGDTESSFFKFRIADITDELVQDSIESTISIEFFEQRPENSQFSKEPLQWSLPTFSSSTRRITWCLNFLRKEIVSCSNARWDLRLKVSSRRGKRRWRFNVKKGAIGPLSFEDMSWRNTGLPPFL